MKTYFFSSKRTPIYGVMAVLSMVLTSCGSYQNSSYYDNDGVYGNSQASKTEPANSSNTQSNKYQEYFSNLNQDSQAFTDVENYTSTTNDSIVKTENYSPNNASWGDNPQSVTVNVYDNNWGYGYWNNYWYGNYWGWNNFYGPNWGWGWNSWYGPSWSLGWGWNNWGYGGYYPYYGGYYGNWHNHYNNYHYNGGRRGTSYAYSGSGNRFGRSSSYNNGNGGRRTNSYSTSTPSRNNNFNSNPRSSSGTRNNTYTPTRSNTNTTYPQTQPTRNNSNTQSTTPVRSYTPSSSGTRSSGGGSYGGGSSSGGGGRSSGGGGGRR